jgi:methionine-rich copper-binding protein CopC
LKAVGGATGKGGTIAVRSYGEGVSWTFGVGDVRPVGTGATPAARGSITLTSCTGDTITGTQFPVLGNPTPPFPVEVTNCTTAAPSLPTGEPDLPQCTPPPVAADDTYSTPQDTPLTVPAPGVLGNDTGSGLAATPQNAAPTSQGGTVTLHADGSFTYTPKAGFTSPPDDSFTYTVTNAGGSATATVRITVVDARPSVVSTSPADGAANVTTGATISIQFSELVNVTGSAFKLECPSGTPVAFTVTPASPAISFVLHPSPALPAGKVCTVTVVASEVTDSASQHPAADFVFSFTVDVPPSVTSTVPASGAANVVPSSTVTINFSESVNVTGSAFQLECPGGTPVAFTVTPASPASSFVLHPTANLPAGATCTATVLASQVTDVDAGQALSADFVFSFTIDVPPSVTGTVPANGAVNVAPSSTVTITFSEPVNVTGSAFQLECPSGTPVAFTVTPASPASSFVLHPTANLPAGGSCTGTVVASQVTDVDAGQHLSADSLFSFSVAIVANDDLYPETVIGNVLVDSNAISFSVAANDQAGANPVISAYDTTSAHGGTVVMTTSGPGVGRFTYNPPPGYQGADSFNYTIGNGSSSASAKVNLNVLGMIWFVNNNAVAGDGRLSSPFNSLAAFQALNNGTGTNPAPSQNIFLYESTTDYVGTVTLLSGQRLIGQDATASLAATTGLTPGTSSAALPAVNSGNATIVRIVNSSGNGIELGTNATLRGLTIGSVSGAAIHGSGFDTLTVADVSVDTTGTALDLSNGTVSALFNSVSSSGGTNNIHLSSLAGTLTVSGGSLSGSSGNAFDVDQGTANITYAGSIASSVRSVSVTNRTGGTVTLSGAISETGTGIFLNNNTGSTITFSGTVTASTGSNPAFTATGGGTVNATGSGSTLTTTTATALNVANTTIGASGLKFQSISAGTAASGPASGIVLNNTGASGGLSVTGTGTAGSGGMIQKTTGPGISLTSTSSVSLSSLNVQNGTDDGINGSSVNGLILSGLSVTGNGDSTTDEGIQLVNVTGNVSLTNVTATGNAHNNVFVDNTAGTLGSFSVTGSTFSNNSAINGNHGFLFQVRGTSSLTSASISGSTFASNKSIGLQVVTADTATILDLTISGNTFTNNQIGVDVEKSQTSNVTCKILDNATITGQNSHAINLFTAAGAGTGGTFKARVAGNVIGNPAVAGSGSAIGNCIRVNMNGDSANTVLLDGNTLRQCPNGRGIEVIGRNGTGGTDLTVTNNDVNPQDTSGFPLSAILVQSNCATVCNTVRSDVRGNTVPAGATTDLLPTYLALVQTSSSTLQLVDTAPASASCTAQLTSTNTGSASASAGCTLIAGPIDTAP